MSAQQSSAEAFARWIAQAFGGGVLPFAFSLPVTSKILADKYHDLRCTRPAATGIWISSKTAPRRR
jgi:hypothetical protein